MGREQSAKEIIINDYNERVPLRNSSLIINDRGTHKRSRIGFTPELARRRAEYLCSKLKSPQSKGFYLKCAWNLTDTCIDRLLAISLTKTEPARYFAAAAANELHG